MISITTHKKKSVQWLNSAAQYQKFAERLKQLKFKFEEIKKLYTNGNILSLPQEKLIWAEGIVDLLDDKE